MIRSWLKWRKTPQADLAEIHELIVLAARRCAYDLNHCSEELGVSRYGIDYGAKARNWLSIFNAGEGGKHYRHRLHMEIINLEIEIERLQKKLEENGIDYEDPNGVPF